MVENSLIEVSRDPKIYANARLLHQLMLLNEEYSSYAEIAKNGFEELGPHTVHVIRI